MIRFRCPQCNKAISVDDSAAGQSGKCPDCDELIKVPVRPPAPPSVVTPTPFKPLGITPD